MPYMLYLTGDTHGDYDIGKLSSRRFKEQKELTKEDYVLISGDFGLVWNNDGQDRYLQKELNNRKFTTLFVDGNHENFDLLKRYPVEYWHGGKVQFIQPTIIHLMRGQVYEINGYTFFVMGGATSIDKMDRVEGISWWADEQPSDAEYEEAISNLNRYNWRVDYVVTHTTSYKMMEKLCNIKERTKLNQFFDMLERDLIFKQWYFGHFHEDRQLDDKHTVLYNNIIKLV